MTGHFSFPADLMTSGARTALLQVANSFLEQNRPIQAIKCLEAIRLSSKTDFPEADAELLLKVGTLHIPQ